VIDDIPACANTNDGFVALDINNPTSGEGGGDFDDSGTGSTSSGLQSAARGDGLGRSATTTYVRCMSEVRLRIGIEY
jgi:hypothetical protein